MAIKKKIFQIPFTEQMARDFNTLYEFVIKQYPFLTIELCHLNDNLRKMIRHGCKIHNRLTSKFEISDTETNYICPECDPKQYNELKKKFEEEKLEFDL